MHHVAIMNKSWKLIDKILQKRKTIESRWYKSKFAPWNRINEGDVVYFKDAGEKITARAEVSRVLQFSDLTDRKRKEIVENYGGEGKICFSSSPDEVIEWTKSKKYCILVFLKNPQKVIPFNINKEGFGNACAWITISDIKTIKI